MCLPRESALCLSALQRKQWNSWIQRAVHDFYHRAEYHQLAEQQGEGQAFLAVYGTVQRFVAFPYLLVPLSSIPGLENTAMCDVTSVYGYPGPVSKNCSPGDSFLRDAMEAIREMWRSQRAVTAFTRTHPLLENTKLLETLGATLPVGQTVSVDLEVSLDESWAQYRRSHRYEVRKGRQAGLQVWHDQAWERVSEFMHLYNTAMEQKGADERYRFGESYFRSLRQALGDAVHLLVVLRGEELCAGGIFAECCGIVQYHLSAIRQDFRRLAPAKVLLDGVRIWARARGNRVFHLGGGVGGSEDSLSLFKAGFSDRRHAFLVWRAILNEPAYDSLIKARAKFAALHGLTVENSGFFPDYRRPLVAAEPVSHQYVETR